ncbi:hypothetical protein GF373_09990 [bacterium]|nr:hypothetical protein [bacterium]
MKKVYVLVMGLALCVAMPLFAQDNGNEQYLNAGFASAAPTLDGELADGEWSDAAVISWDATDRVRPGISSTDINPVGGPNGDGVQTYEDSHAVAYIMNDAEFLYVAIDVTDDILVFDNVTSGSYKNDGAEIRIDGNYSRLTTKEGDNMGFSTNIMGDNTNASNVQDGAEVIASTKADGSGFYVEFKTPIAGFEPMIGFEIAINDSDDANEEQRDTQYRWNSPTDPSWQDESQWGNLTLATEENPGPSLVFDSPAASAAPTLDGSLADGEWADALVIAWDAQDLVRPGLTHTDINPVGGPNGDGVQSYADSHAVAYVMNDAEFLYVAIDVTDDILVFDNVTSGSYKNDGAEIRIDGNYSRLTTKEGDNMGFSTNIMGDNTNASNVQDGAEIIAVTKADESGFYVEFKTPIAGFEPTIGFEIAINDSDDASEEQRDTQYRINSPTDPSWQDESQWSSLNLAQAASSVDSSQWEIFE